MLRTPRADATTFVATLMARAQPDSPIARLTDREREVLELMAQGRSNNAIATALFVTEKAISKRTSNIFMKLVVAYLQA